MSAKKLKSQNLSYAPEPGEHIKVHPTLKSLQKKEGPAAEQVGRRLFPVGPLLLCLVAISAAMTSLLVLDRLEKANDKASSSAQASLLISELTSNLSRIAFVNPEEELLLNCGNGYFTNKPIPGFDCVSVKEVKATRGRGNRYITPAYTGE